MNSISDKYHPGYPEWHLRDSGLSLCEAFSLPPRAIIEAEANRHSAGAEAVFFASASLTKASFRREDGAKKEADPNDMTPES